MRNSSSLYGFFAACAAAATLSACNHHQGGKATPAFAVSMPDQGVKIICEPSRDAHIYIHANRDLDAVLVEEFGSYGEEEVSLVYDKQGRPQQGVYHFYHPGYRAPSLEKIEAVGPVTAGVPGLKNSGDAMQLVRQMSGVLRSARETCDMHRNNGTAAQLAITPDKNASKVEDLRDRFKGMEIAQRLNSQLKP